MKKIILLTILSIFLANMTFASTSLPYSEFTPIEDKVDQPFTISKYWVFGTGLLSLSCYALGVFQFIDVNSKKSAAKDAYNKYMNLPITSTQAEYDKYFQKANDNLKDAKSARILGYSLIGAGVVLTGLTSYLMLYVETDLDIKIQSTTDDNKISLSLRF